MLQKHSFEEQAPESSLAHFLTPSYYLGVARRRWLHFLIPFVTLMAAGSVAVAVWPASYVAEGKILVESQQIPSDLVRPTVTAVANERIQVIEQRIMTRDNLLAIAAKFNMFPDRNRWSGTDILDFMRARTQIRPLELRLVRNSTRQTVAFTIGFEHEQPVIAARVANELMTMILAEDVKTRTSFASETTRFLDRESKRLETELNSVEAQIVEMKRKQFANPAKTVQPAETQLAALKAELMQRSGVFAESHPDMKLLKQRIAALESSIVPDKTKPVEINLDALERQQEALQKGLESTNQKLAAARLGESLERGQQSERLEVIEQPSVPQKPVKPNRMKLFALALALALAAGGGLVLVFEMLDDTIRRSSDFFQVVDSHLVVGVPFIATGSELRRARRLKVLAVASLVVAVLAAIAGAVLFVPSISAFLSAASIETLVQKVQNYIGW